MKKGIKLNICGQNNNYKNKIKKLVKIFLVIIFL